MAPEGLDGKVVLVTGSGCGLGAALARAAAERGARVVLNCRSEVARVDALAADLRQKGAEAIALRADVTEHDQAGRLVDEALGAFGRIDVLLNIVGSFLWKPVADMDPKEWRATVACPDHPHVGAGRRADLRPRIPLSVGAGLRGDGQGSAPPARPPAIGMRRADPA